MASREASHAGSWYTDDAKELSRSLDHWLSRVPGKTAPIGTLSSEQGEVEIPSAGARVIIAPHAGYAYSGPAAAWAYKAMDWSKAKRIFLLGPSHHHYLTNAALSQCETYETPLGDLHVDTNTMAELHSKGKFEKMSLDIDEAEHSLEMHLPYIYKMLSLNFKSAEEFPLLVPVMVGNTSPNTEQSYGNIFAPYLVDPTSIFIISSDFCHWGSRFRYTYYDEGLRNPWIPDTLKSTSKPYHLGKVSRSPSSPKVYESIIATDQASMDAVESGKHELFIKELERTGNTVCGRHPIGVVMAAIEKIQQDSASENAKGRFKFVRYERSDDPKSIRDSSVSYCSAFAVF